MAKLLTVGELKKLLARFSDDTVITVCGTEDVLIRLEPESKVSPEIISFDAGDIDPYQCCENNQDRHEVDQCILWRRDA